MDLDLSVSVSSNSLVKLDKNNEPYCFANVDCLSIPVSGKPVLWIRKTLQRNHVLENGFAISSFVPSGTNVMEDKNGNAFFNIRIDGAELARPCSVNVWTDWAFVDEIDPVSQHQNLVSTMDLTSRVLLYEGNASALWSKVNGILQELSDCHGVVVNTTRQLDLLIELLDYAPDIAVCRTWNHLRAGHSRTDIPTLVGVEGEWPLSYDELSLAFSDHEGQLAELAQYSGAFFVVGEHASRSHIVDHLSWLAENKPAERVYIASQEMFVLWLLTSINPISLLLDPKTGPVASVAMVQKSRVLSWLSGYWPKWLSGSASSFHDGVTLHVLDTPELLAILDAFGYDVCAQGFRAGEKYRRERLDVIVLGDFSMFRGHLADDYIERWGSEGSSERLKMLVSSLSSLVAKGSGLERLKDGIAALTGDVGFLSRRYEKLLS